jgi:hypothetical protein
MAGKQISIEPTGAASASTVLAERLERCEVVFYKACPFPLPQGDDQRFLVEQNLAGGHKNISFNPHTGKIGGFRFQSSAQAERLRELLAAFSRHVTGWLANMLPQYARSWRLDKASLRPEEEATRHLRLTARNDLLHVDAFPTRPTGGDMILRLFTNIHQLKPRVWMTSDPFGALAPRYASDAGLGKVAKHPKGTVAGRLLGAFGGVQAKRSAYDRFMLGFHDYLKFNGEYQQSCAKYRFEFPPDSTWMVFTDVVPHAVLSGQYALEQTVIVARESLARRENAPIEILQGLCGRQLA